MRQLDRGGRRRAHRLSLGPPAPETGESVREVRPLLLRSRAVGAPAAPLDSALLRRGLVAGTRHVAAVRLALCVQRALDRRSGRRRCDRLDVRAVVGTALRHGGRLLLWRHRRPPSCGWLRLPASYSTADRTQCVHPGQPWVTGGEAEAAQQQRSDNNAGGASTAAKEAVQRGVRIGAARDQKCSQCLGRQTGLRSRTGDGLEPKWLEPKWLRTFFYFIVLCFKNNKTN